jgi:hypothetical protein
VLSLRRIGPETEVADAPPHRTLAAFFYLIAFRFFGSREYGLGLHKCRKFPINLAMRGQFNKKLSVARSIFLANQVSIALEG